jgi:DNA ligase D-like protein (predicted ligase)
MRAEHGWRSDAPGLGSTISIEASLSPVRPDLNGAIRQLNCTVLGEVLNGIVHTGDPIAKLPEAVRECARKRPQPSWIAPMLATLVAEPFSGKDWIFEPKLDGERCLTFRTDKSTRLLSRNKKGLNETYPELLQPLASQATENYIADGEIVAFKGDVTSFSQLQRRMQVRDPDEARRVGVEVFYYLFDLLYLNGYDLRDVPLIHRKALLKEAFEFRDPLRFTQHRERDGEAYYREACHKGLEGVIAKRADSIYVSRRSRDWLKFKCWEEQEFVIAGFTDPKGDRVGFGALLLGYYEGGKLRYAGKVGTGFDTGLLVSLGKELSALEVNHSPFAEEVKAGKGVHWVRPKLVAQVSFTQWTRDGRLRHPRFLGIRRDKDPREVVRERPL